jgi:hypothetical protein
MRTTFGVFMNENARAAIAKYILGLRESVEIFGNHSNVAILSETIQASKELFLVLNENESDEVIQQAIDRKRLAVERWKNLTGEKWLL